MAKTVRNSKKKQCPGEATVLPDSDTLCIDCKGCQQIPDAGSPVCINCVCSAVFRHGTADRIKLSAGKDTEISGPAAEIICELAQIGKPVSVVPDGRKCAKCPRSPERLFDAVWSEFPDPSFGSAYARLYVDGREPPECAACMQRTYSMLKSSEDEMGKIKEKTSDLAKNKGVFE